jgi:YfiH family protein
VATPQWTLVDNDDCPYFELRDSHYSMKLTTGEGQKSFCNATNLILLKQIHSAKIINVDRNKMRIGDGLLSSQMQNVLGIKIADCLPVYLYNETTMCIIHCGWRGIVSGIAQRARYLMGTYSYVLGSCIGPECYEVKRDVIDQFKNRYSCAVIKKKTAFFLDLKKAVIKDLGTKSMIASLDLCTKCHPEFFYSFRRGDRKKRNFALMSRI